MRRAVEARLQLCGAKSLSYFGSALTSRLKTTLAFDEVVAPAPGQGQNDQLRLGLLVHGLLGTGRNWRTFARSLAKQAAVESGSGWRILLVDQRNHGHSAELSGLDPPHTLEAAAQDLIHLIKQKFSGQHVSVIAGHSLGGKTTLEYLKQSSEGKVKAPDQAWILDANIGEVTLDKDAPGDVDKMVQEIRKLPAPIASREWVYKYMQGAGYSEGLRLWMGSNLVPDGQGKYKWGFNIEGASDMYESYKRASYWDLIQKPPQGTVLNIVRAAKSDRWTKQTLSRLQEAQDVAALNANGGQAGQLRTHVLPKAGHWLHVDNPHGLMDMMLPSFVNPGT